MNDKFKTKIMLNCIMNKVFKFIYRYPQLNKYEEEIIKVIDDFLVYAITKNKKSKKITCRTILIFCKKNQNYNKNKRMNYLILKKFISLNVWEGVNIGQLIVQLSKINKH